MVKTWWGMLKTYGKTLKTLQKISNSSENILENSRTTVETRDQSAAFHGKLLGSSVCNLLMQFRVPWNV